MEFSKSLMFHRWAQDRFEYPDDFHQGILDKLNNERYNARHDFKEEYALGRQFVTYVLTYVTSTNINPRIDEFDEWLDTLILDKGIEVSYPDPEADLK